MRKRILIVLLIGLLSLSALAADPKPTAPANAAATFEQLKRLVGEWEAPSDMGKITARYELVSDGHVLLEHLNIAGVHDNMVTAYYLDGDKLGLTHFCGLGNQPRMLATGVGNDRTIRFAFAGAANLANAKDKHMHSAAIRLLDNDHFSADWTLFGQSKPSMNVALHYVRVK